MEIMDKKPYIACIMVVWEEDQMIPLAIDSTRHFVDEYLIVNNCLILKDKNKDRTKDVIFACRDKWNLKMQYFESDKKLRDCRQFCYDISKDYVDYYLIQDGDEVYFNEGPTNITKLYDFMLEGYEVCLTPMIYLHTRLDMTLYHLTWLIPHIFFFKNMKDEIYWRQDSGDIPSVRGTRMLKCYDPFTDPDKSKMNIPFKFDCNVKNFKRLFLREVFTNWHDSGSNLKIDEFADLNHHTMKYYRNINPNITMKEVIENEEKEHIRRVESLISHKFYNEDEYFKYPSVIKKYLDKGYVYGYTNEIL